MLKKFLLLFFLGTALFTLTIRSMTYMVPFYVLIIAAFCLSFMAILSTLKNDPFSTIRIGVIIKTYIKVCFTCALIVVYGLFTSTLYGWNIKEALSLAFRLIPLALYPIYAYLFPKENDWKKMFVIFIVIGTLSAILDLRASVEDELIRLMSEDFISIDHFYALLFATGLLILVKMDTKIEIIILVCMPILLWRMFRSISRAEIFIFSLFFLFVMTIKLFFDNHNMKFFLSKKLILYALIGIFISYKLYTYLDIGSSFNYYYNAYVARSQIASRSILYRTSELSNAIQYGGFFGQGWGSIGDFSDALQYTTGKGFASKSYCHNIVAFLIWKLGFIIGGILILSFLYFVINNFIASFKQRDRIGLLISGILASWMLHCAVNMYFAKPELNLWVSSWIGFFFWRETTQNYYINKTFRNRIMAQPQPRRGQ